MTIHEKLSAIQSELSVPKGQMNKFGGYKYRSCEDILEAVKPLLKKHELVLTISDDVVLIGDRVYVKATASIGENGEDLERISNISVDAFAREAETKKGMDEAQITGAASSYARKYALNGLFCIDDTKDADATNKHEEPVKKREEVDKCHTGTYTKIIQLCKDTGTDFDKMREHFKSEAVPTKEQAEKMLAVLEERKKELSKELDSLSQE